MNEYLKRKVIIMLKFGKKVSYRPILVSFYFTLIPLIAAIAGHFPIMYLVSLAVFLTVLLAYYLPNLPLIFNYWESDQDTISYNDMTTYKRRISMILVPHKNQLVTINKKDIQSITVTGKINNPDEITTPLEVTGYFAVLTPLLSMLKNPITLNLVMTDGQTIELSVSRDFAYDNKKTIEKLNQFFDSLDDSQIKIINYPNHNNVSFN
jgi:hypothetical protein